MHWPPIEWHHSKHCFSHFVKALYTNSITFLARRNGGRVLLNSLQFPLLPAVSPKMYCPIYTTPLRSFWRCICAPWKNLNFEFCVKWFQPQPEYSESWDQLGTWCTPSILILLFLHCCMLLTSPYFSCFQKDLYGLNVCGEGGEYETFTLDCPLFNKKIVL